MLIELYLICYRIREILVGVYHFCAVVGFVAMLYVSYNLGTGFFATGEQVSQTFFYLLDLIYNFAVFFGEVVVEDLE